MWVSTLEVLFEYLIQGESCDMQSLPKCPLKVAIQIHSYVALTIH